MTRDEVLELAIDAELWNRSDEPDDCNGLGDLALSLVEFAKLVAEKEREVCEKLCEDREDYMGEHCNAIRARK